MLEAYSKGELSGSDSMWIEQLIQKNPMVKAVAESMTSINVATVKSISRKTSVSISNVYLSKIGFWSKYGVWIGLSSIALIIGLALFFQNNTINSVYEQTAMTTELNSPENSPSNMNSEAVVATTIDDSENDNNLADNKDFENVKKEDVSEFSSKNNDKSSSIGTDHLKVKGQESKMQSNTKNKMIVPNPLVEDPKTDNTRSFASGTKTMESQSVLLSVQNVQILAKTNPKDLKGKSNNGSNSYSMDDVPKFTGGDRALQDYFVGKLRPIKIKKEEDHFDRNVMVDLEINARGKLKDYTIYGDLHPTHQKALIEAINNLPQFSKGSENVVYSIGISF